MLIRRERPGDESGVQRIDERAFGGPDEAAIVNALRASGCVPLSLVAELDGALLGHILFSPVSIEPSGNPVSVVGLAPMAVVPEHQRRGVGSRLVAEGLARLRAAGHQAVVVLGHPGYYPRLGFSQASLFGLRCEFACPDEAFMAIALAPGALTRRAGLVRYRPEFRQA